MATKTWAGTVYRYGSEERLSGVIFLAESKGHVTQTAVSNDDGDFTLLLEENVVWRITITQGYSRPEVLPAFELTIDRIDERMNLQGISSTIDRKAGRVFLYTSILALIILSIVYALLHMNPRIANSPLSGSLLLQINETQRVIDSLKIPEENARNDIHKGIMLLIKKSQTLTLDTTTKNNIDSLPILLEGRQYRTLNTQVNDLSGQNHFKKETDTLKNYLKEHENVFEALESSGAQLYATLNVVLRDTRRIDIEDKLIIRNLMATIRLQVDSYQLESASKLLNQLRGKIKAPAVSGFIPWTSHPWQLLEILFWALAGILAHKIIESGYYLRFNRFYREGINMHIAHIVAIPFLVLVGMILLSLVSFQVTLPDTGTKATIDLSNQYFLASISFILAFRPWGIWRFIVAAGDRIMGDKDGEASS
jgi:hypothetical protein